MVLFGDVFTEVIRAMRAERNPEEQERAMRYLNQDALAIGLRDSWADLRVRAEYTYTGSAIQLPSNLAGIDLLWDDINGTEYQPRNRSASEKEENAFRYITYPVGTALTTATDVTVAQDSTSMASSTLAAVGDTLEDEYLYIDGEPQLYQITAFDSDTSLFTITPGYRGTGSKTSASAVVRPPTTLMLDLVAPEDYAVPTGAFILYSWRRPDVLRDPGDLVPFPTSDVLTHRTISRLPEARKLRPISQAQVAAALQEALALNPDKPMPRFAKNQFGNKLDFSRNHYSPRMYENVRVNRVYDTWRRNNS